jgi:glycosyltransferase involved in cell wall biosynthesis
MTASIVIPVYNNATHAPLLIERLEAVIGAMTVPVEVVFVVDGSPDDSYDVLARLLPGAQFASRLVRHSRNFGSFAAIRTGLAASTGDMVGVMAADLQEPPELIGELFAALESGFDIAVGRRTARADGGASSRVFWALYRRLVMRELPPGGVDIFACTRAVADELAKLREANSSLVGLLFWIGFRRAEIPYERMPRPDGRSGWTFRKKSRYLFDSVYSFTDLPISVLLWGGVVGGILTLVAAIAVTVSYLLGGITEPGYTPLMLVILFSTFTMLSAVGIVGSYVWRAYENTKGRPLSVIAGIEHWSGKGR